MVSIIIPSYNCREYISETINSVLNQTYSDYEVFIIDDKSSDGTPELVQNKLHLITDSI